MSMTTTKAQTAGRKRQSGSVEPVSRDQVARGAKIMGENSGFAKMLAEYDRRIAAGTPTAIYSFCGRWIVGDPILAATEARHG